MLESVDERREVVLAVIKRYAAWRGSEVGKVLKQRNGDMPSRRQVEILVDDARLLAADARSALAGADAVALSANAELRDVARIAEELELAVSEVSDAITPDAVWRIADEQTKMRLTQQMPIPAAHVNRLHARLSGETRKQREADEAAAKATGAGNGKPPR